MSTKATPNQQPGESDPGHHRGPAPLMWLAVAALLALAGCAGEFTTQSEPLRLFAGSLPDAIVNEPYSTPIEVVGGLRPYDFSVESGNLPPGLALEGGSLRGVPSATGTFEFTVSVSDANLSSTFESYTLRVITPPPPSLSLQPPDTEVRGAVTLRARVDDARSLAGLRTEIRWDPASFALQDGSVSATRQGMALFHETEAGVLRVDLALLTGPLTGSGNLFSFTLTPLDAPALVGVRAVTEFVSRRGGELLFDHQTSAQGPGSIGAGATPPQEPAGSQDGEQGDEPPDQPSDAPGDGSSDGSGDPP